MVSPTQLSANLTAELVNHLWQSTVFLAGVWLLTLGLQPGAHPVPALAAGFSEVSRSVFAPDRCGRTAAISHGRPCRAARFFDGDGEYR